MLPVHHQVFQHQHKAALSRADGNKKVDHTNDHSLISKNKNPPPGRLLQNQAQTSHLLLVVRLKIRFLKKQVAEEFSQLGQVVQCRWFDSEIGHGRLISHQFPSGNPRAEEISDQTFDPAR